MDSKRKIEDTATALLIALIYLLMGLVFVNSTKAGYPEKQEPIEVNQVLFCDYLDFIHDKNVDK